MKTYYTTEKATAVDGKDAPSAYMNLFHNKPPRKLKVSTQAKLRLKVLSEKLERELKEDEDSKKKREPFPPSNQTLR
jgi:hypothetical protein